MYAIKEAREPRWNEQIRAEMEVLRNIEDHEHIIRLVCALERDDQLMLMLQPVASSDLQGFLQSYRDNESNPQPGVNLLAHREVLLSAFGCLSHGLRHLHTNVRHKDIKLDNILYVKGNFKAGKARLIFTDFGIAHYYGSGNSSTTNNNWHFAWKCTAPEVLRDDPDYVKQRWHLIQQPRTRTSTLDPRPPFARTSSRPGAAQSHNTRSDSFSLGACFMDILAALVQEDIPNMLKKPAKDFIFAEHVEAVISWAQGHESVEPNPVLRAAFHVARFMIQYDKQDRWDMNQVIKYLGESGEGSHLFCTDLCRAKALSLAETPIDEDATQATRQNSRITEESLHGEPEVIAESSTALVKQCNGLPTSQSRPHAITISTQELKPRELPRQDDSNGNWNHEGYFKTAPPPAPRSSNAAVPKNKSW